MESVSFGALAAQQGHAAFWCAMPGRHRGSLIVSGAQGVERWGADTTIEDIRSRLRCDCCGYRGPRVVAEVWGPGPRKGADGWLGYW